MVSLYFGLPGSGKTTVMTHIAYKVLTCKKPKYKHIFCNVHLSNIPPFDKVTYIDGDDLGKYNFENGLILIDEASLEYDSRDYKNFSKDKIKYFLLHRHYNVDIFLFTQQWDAVDRKIRVITDRVYYVYKTLFLGLWITKYYRIPYGIIIPDSKKNQSGEKLGEIVQGYCKPNLMQRIFCKRIFRPKYYKYFNSWYRPKLKEPPYKIKDITNNNKLAKKEKKDKNKQNMNKEDKII